MRSLVMLILLGGCAGSTGDVQVTAWGEEAVLNGHTTTDGWTVTFDHWLTGVPLVTLTDPDDNDVLAESTEGWVLDWTIYDTPAPVTTLTEVPSGRVDVAFAVDAVEGATPVGDLDAELVDGLVDAGAVHRIIGQGTDGQRTVTFDWTLDNPVAYTLCRNGLDDTPGLAIPADGSVDLQLTLHSDHLLWDQVGTEQAALTFQAIADADADGDGEITAEELRAVDTLEAGFETGGFDLPNLYEFLRFAVAQGAHVNGGGLCQVRAR